MSDCSFAQLGLAAPLQKALQGLGHRTPTPVQAAAIPPLLAGRDLLGCSQTGTGKTGAFALPILHKFAADGRRAAPRGARALILSPTRELCQQIGAAFQAYGRHLNVRLTCVYGGVGQVPQVRASAAGVEVLVATPGRLLDLMGQGHLRLKNLEILVLDEADRMLDMGFMPDIKRLLAQIPARRQNLFFSATMPPPIVQLAGDILVDPVKVQTAPMASPVAIIKQRVFFVARAAKRDMLDQVLTDPSAARVLVFTRTKYAADRLARQLAAGRVSAEAIHGGKSQRARNLAMANFRNGACRVLVATDVAARGLDVEGITHVINFDLPVEPECYVHRIGRTGRAGAGGVALSFCDQAERSQLRSIERLIQKAVPVGDFRAGDRPGEEPARTQAPLRAAAANKQPRSPDTQKQQRGAETPKQPWRPDTKKQQNGPGAKKRGRSSRAA
ncbi:MAG: DEAD/DEAH box helicase [Deltaproteobacteria bacterium]|nr:DEAD/DEAH box helicase [Deltaproteobacteria bacterium]